MKALATITSKGQVTIPRIVRRSLGLREGDRLEFEIAEGTVTVHSVRPALSSAGVLKKHLPPGWKPRTPAEMDEAILRHLAEKHCG